MNSQEVKNILRAHGLTVSAFARAHGFNENLVYAVLAGKNKASRGESFRIAVALGLKQQPNTAEAPDFVRKLLASQQANTANVTEAAMT